MADSYAQIYTFIFYSVLIGALLGAVYDVFRIIRIAFDTAGRGIVTDIVYFICDVMFFIIAAIGSAIFIFHVNNGRIRGIALFGSLVGFLLYYNTAGRLVSAVSGLIIAALYRVLRFVRDIILFSLLRLFKGIGDAVYSRRQTGRRIRRFKKKGC